MDDEFSYIVSAETFAAGRLAYPAHQLPHFFETFHVLQTPTYVSKYFPGNAIFLTIGIVLTGSARFGQWLAFASMAMSLAWCLRGWVARDVARAAVAIAILILASTSWASGFWGAPVAAVGAALVIGAFGPLRSRGPLVGVLAGTGAALLALTRPWEGFWVCVPAAVGVAWWLFQTRASRVQRFTRVVVPGVAVLATGLIFLVRHNEATTGSWLVPPYALYERSAVGAPPMVWQDVTPPSRILRATEKARAAYDMEPYELMRSEPARALVRRGFLAIDFFGGIFVALSLLFILFVPRRRDYVLPAAALAAGLAAVSVSSFFMSHYLAALIPALLVLVATGAERAWRSPGRPRAIAALAYGAALISSTHRVVLPTEDRLLIVQPSFWANRRAEVARRLEAIPGRHLVFVRYAPAYASRQEWVRNEADRSGARTLWVHDLGEAANTGLLRVEGGRTAWLIEVTDPTLEETPELRPYPVPWIQASQGTAEGGRTAAP